MIAVAFLHGLRAGSWWTFVGIRATSEPPACTSVGSNTPSTHPILGDELRALRRLRREPQEPKSPFIFTSERGAPFTIAGFARMVERAGVQAKFGFKAHPHMLRHACSSPLANKGHDGSLHGIGRKRGSRIFGGSEPQGASMSVPSRKTTASRCVPKW